MLSEYGFVLPRDCTSEEALEREGDRGGKDDGQQPWRGNRYCDVDVSDEVEALFEQQGEEGVRKRELLEAQGYWR